MKLRPFRQGSLDGMCGVYAVINATRLAAWPACHLTENSCQELFAVLASELEPDQLLEVLTGGCRYPVISRLLRAAGSWLEDEYELRLNYRRPYHVARPSRAAALRRLSDHLAQGQSSAIICLTGPWDDHWTVARAITASGSLALFDSTRRRYLSSRSLKGTAATKVVYRDLYFVSTKSA